jgi:hypothetical protein
MARWLRPDLRGLGTHEQLFGLQPCGFVLTTGLPCPTCGMTTAFALMMHGHPLAAFLTQPAGAVFCLATVALLVYALSVAASGWLLPLNWAWIGPIRFMLAIAMLILAAWAFKMASGLLSGELPMR